MKTGIPLELLTNRQRYYKPFNLDDALRCRREVPEAQVVAGATDLALRQTKKKGVNAGFAGYFRCGGIEVFWNHRKAIPLEINPCH